MPSTHGSRHHGNSSHGPENLRAPVLPFLPESPCRVLREQDPFEFRTLEDEDANQELALLWPMKGFPVLVDAGRTVIEAACIIEYLGIHHHGLVRLVPGDADAALEVRMMDRFFDNYISTPQQKIVFDRLRDEVVRDPHGVTEASTMLDIAYAWLDKVMADLHRAAGDDPSLADCGAAPFLFYADWLHPIADPFANVRAYRNHLLAGHHSPAPLRRHDLSVDISRAARRAGPALSHSQARDCLSLCSCMPTSQTGRHPTRH